MTTVAATATPLAPVPPDAPGQLAYDHFSAEPDTLLVAVVDAEGRPVGMLERNSFLVRMASQYGRALYARRPISMLMDADPLVVEHDRPISEFTNDALSERAGDLMRGFIVTREGRYLGVASLLDLMRATSEETRRTAGQLFSLAQNLTAAKAAVKREKVFIDTVVKNIPVALFVKDLQEGRFVLVNRAGEEALGLSREQLVGRTVHESFPLDDARRFAAQDAAVIAAGEVQQLEEEIRRPDGGLRVLRTRKLAVNDETGGARHLLTVSEDITERKAAEATIERLAHYDELTEPANRALFHRQLEAALVAARRRDAPVAVLCLDLDHFKSVNDTLGHAAGDALLTAVAARLRRRAGEGACVGRLGGDDFAVAASGLDAAGARALAASIVEVLSEPFEVAGRPVSVGASVGVALHPQDGDGGVELLNKADMALYRVKSEGRGAVHFFEREMNDRLRDRRALELDLRRALGRGEFVLEYQPLYNLREDRISGCEALVRWDHPERGRVSPLDFIPVAEDIGLISALGEWVLRTACLEAAAWPGATKVAVNVSPLQFRDEALASTVVSALAASGLDPRRLELEITEGVLMRDDARNMQTLHRLRALGCRVALDDFGTGYSSLSYLRRFPFDKIKIDRAFVRDLPAAEDSVAIIRAVTQLSTALGMTTTAEGVETPEQLAALRANGCTEVQGFLLGRPASAEAIRERLAAPHPAQVRAA